MNIVIRFCGTCTGCWCYKFDEIKVNCYPGKFHEAYKCSFIAHLHFSVLGFCFFSTGQFFDCFIWVYQLSLLHVLLFLISDFYFMFPSQGPSATRSLPHGYIITLSLPWTWRGYPLDYTSTDFERRTSGIFLFLILWTQEMTYMYVITTKPVTVWSELCVMDGRMGYHW